MNRDTALGMLRTAKESLAAEPGMYGKLCGLLDAPNVDWDSWALLGECDTPGDVIEYFKTKLPTAGASSNLPQELNKRIWFGRRWFIAHHITNYDQLCQAVQRKWRELCIVEYDFFCMQPQSQGGKPKVLFTVFDETSFQRFLALPDLPACSLSVNGLTVGFSAFHDVKAVCEDQLNCSTLLTDKDDIFVVLELTEQQAIDVQLEALVSSVVVSLQRWHEVLPHLDDLDECGRRGYINLILAGAACLAARVYKQRGEHPLHLIPELRIVGRCAAGPVDYVALYRFVMIMVCEAKQAMKDGYAQVLAQLAAARENFAAHLLRSSGKEPSSKKRRHFEEEMLTRLTSAAILSNGKAWSLLQYHPPRPDKPACVYVGRVELCLDNRDERLMASNVKDLLLKIAQLIVGQMKEVDNAVSENPTIKAASQEDRLHDILLMSKELSRSAAMDNDQEEGEAGDEGGEQEDDPVV